MKLQCFLFRTWRIFKVRSKDASGPQTLQAQRTLKIISYVEFLTSLEKKKNSGNQIV